MATSSQAGLAAPGNARISGASHRLRALAALSGSLTDALAPKDAADPKRVPDGTANRYGEPTHRLRQRRLRG